MRSAALAARRGRSSPACSSRSERPRARAWPRLDVLVGPVRAAEIVREASLKAPPLLHALARLRRPSLAVHQNSPCSPGGTCTGGGHVVLENRKKDRVELVHPAWLGSQLASERMRFTPSNHSDGPHWLARAIPHVRTREHRVAHSPHESPQRGHECRVGGSCGSIYLSLVPRGAVHVEQSRRA